VNLRVYRQGFFRPDPGGERSAVEALQTVECRGEKRRGSERGASRI
jgi:hypothetical protein